MGARNSSKKYYLQEILIGKEGQKVLSKSRIAIVGLGALGSLSAQLLARLGVGMLKIIDRDYVEESNLHRQFFDEKDIGKAKAFALKKSLTKINSSVNVEAHFENLDHESVRLLKKVDLILDCTDNFETRFIINDFSLRYDIPFIYSSALSEQGYVYAIIPKKTACFSCLFANSKVTETCETAGVINTITTIISALQVNEAIKVLLNNQTNSQLLYFDVKKNVLEKIKVKKRKGCEACRGIYTYLENRRGSGIIKFCGSDTYLIRKKLDYNGLKKRLSKIGKVRNFGNAFNFKGLTIFKDGRILVKAKNKMEAASMISRFIGT